MSKLSLSILGIVAFVVAATSAVTGCSGVFNSIADTMLANEVRFDDREPPRTAYAIAASSDDVQSIGGQGSGLSCSLPPGTQALAFSKGSKEAPIALQMRQACAFHDYCYRHGNATYGYSQADCDYMLQQQAFRLCKFIKPEESVGICETNARKVTLGVRLGGFGSFKRARAVEDEKASTFFEFDPYPVRANTYRVMRIADAPRQWVKDGLLPKAAYHFDIHPSGSLVSILGWKPDGSMVCNRFQLPGTYDAITSPPMVVRDSVVGEDWFVWWRRHSLGSTGGRFALLPPGRATSEDWKVANGGFERVDQNFHCERKELWDADSSNPPPSAFTVERDLEFSELHPVSVAGTAGRLRLMGLSTHSCDHNGKDLSPCLVDVTFDTGLRGFQEDPKSPTRYRASEKNCVQVEKGRPEDDCDRYRNYVGAPFVVAQDSPPSLVWMRRGKGNGDGYEQGASVLHYTIGETRSDPAKDLGKLLLAEFPETMEPAFITNVTPLRADFLSLAAIGGRVQMNLASATPKIESSKSNALTCFPLTSASWLHRPSFFVRDRQDASRSYIVFTRARANEPGSENGKLDVHLDVAVATLVDRECTGVREHSFPSFFEGFATKREYSQVAKFASIQAPSDVDVRRMEEAIGPYVERVRGGQMALADVNGDGVPDLVQLSQIPREGRFGVSTLIGSINSAGLSFREFPKSSVAR